MTAWVAEDWTFWIWASRCSECGRFLKDAEPIMADTGVGAVKGFCSKCGEVETHDFEIGDLTG